MKPKDIRLLIADLGILGIPIGQKVADDFKSVEYWTPAVKSFMGPKDWNIGTGIPGIMRVDSYEDAKERIKKENGIIYFPDVGMGDMLEAAKRESIRVVGAGNSGELEMSRIKAKKVLRDVGLPMPEWGWVKGIEALEKILREKEDIYLKLDTENRAVMETWHHKNWKESRTTFYKLAHDLQCFIDITLFIWEKPWPGVEVGQDTFVCNGIFFEESLYGIEDKGNGYTCVHRKAADFPAAIRKVNNAMAPVELKYGTCGPISSEIRVNKEGIGYYGDFTRRQGNPPTACISKQYKNLGPIINGLADGVEVKPEWAAQYASEISIEYPGADVDAVPMPLSDKDTDLIILRAACKLDGMFWNIPFPEVGNVVVKAVGLGDTREESQNNCIRGAEKACDKISGAYFDRYTFERIEEELAKGKRYGLGEM